MTASLDKTKRASGYRIRIAARCFADTLRVGGYATAIGGKWQINHLGMQPDALTHHGFDEHCVWARAEAGRAELDGRYWDGQIMNNGRRGNVSYGPDTINSFLIDFIRRKREQPFLIYYPMLLTDGPHTTTARNKEDAPEGKEAYYAGNVTYMDQLVGKLIDAVDRAGLRNNTLIVFTGDNGSAEAGNLNGKPFEKGKGQQADRGAHVPFVVRRIRGEDREIDKDAHLLRVITKTVASAVL